MRSAVRLAVLERPAFALYLAALATLPFKWLSPLSWLSERSGWTDALLAAAAAAWALERWRSGRVEVPAPLRAVCVALAGFLVLSALSAVLVADDRGEAALSVLTTAELVVLATLTADYARRRRERNAIVLAILLGALVTAGLAAVGVGLFYLGSETSLVDPNYGSYLIASDSYTRVAAGFESAPLLGSYCIFAAAVLALDSDVWHRLRRAAGAALAVVVVLTLSRAVLGFLTAMAIRVAASRTSPRARSLAAAAVATAVVAVVALTVGHLEFDPTRPSTISYTVPDPSNRRETVDESWETLKSHPLLGAGPGALTGGGQRAHLTPLNVAATVGLPALLFLAAAVFLLWRRRPRPTDVALWSGLAGLALDGLAQDVEHFRHVWVMVGLAAASVAADRPEEPDSRPGSG